ncbi:MAG: ABC transporter permease subunit [Armatimonadetes bacterium]|nr:ABC transporter permease subunit [Armatimonadota bacterium]
MKRSIFDLSYRNYGAALVEHDHAWLPIARHVFLTTIKKKAFWILTGFSGWFYAVTLIIVFVMEQIAQSARQRGAGEAANFLDRIEWKGVFLGGIGTAQMFFCFVAILAGAGAIAADNRANALLAYLSKPCTKSDYVFGKWLGIFLSLMVFSLLPNLIFYFYGALSYHSYGFLSQDKLMFFKLVLLCMVSSAFYTSLILGISSVFNLGRNAGATMAAVYFLGFFFTVMVQSSSMQIDFSNGSVKVNNSVPIRMAFHSSVDGLVLSLAKNMTGSTVGGLPLPQGATGNQPMGISAAPLAYTIPVLALVSFGMTGLAWKRVRAVEVIG